MLVQPGSGAFHFHYPGFRLHLAWYWHVFPTSRLLPHGKADLWSESLRFL